MGVRILGKRNSVEIDNDVWIGTRIMILEGVAIGDDIVATVGEIVTKDISPYAIVGGVPVKIIGYRFAEGTIQTLLKMKW